MISEHPPLLRDDALRQAIDATIHALPATLASPLPLAQLLACVVCLADAVRHDRLAQPLPLTPSQRTELLAHCDADALRARLEHELGEAPFCLRRFNYCQARYEAWRPLGCVLHVMPDAAPLSPLQPFLAILESLLVGNVNWVRLSDGDALSAPLLAALAACDDSGRVAAHVRVWPLMQQDIAQLLPHVDAVSAWGADVAWQALRHDLRPGCRWIAWDRTISFIYLTPAALPARDDALGASHVRFFDDLVDQRWRVDQNAGASAQLVLVDSEDASLLARTGRWLAAAFTRRFALSPSPCVDAKDIAGAHVGQTWSGPGWHLVWQHEAELATSPSAHTLLLRPLPRAQLHRVLFKWRGALQTCGLACGEGETATLAEALLGAGVGRVTTHAAMHQTYHGEPHDNVRTLVQLARRVSVSPAAAQVVGCATLSTVEAGDDARFNPLARLLLHSGGAAGTLNLSTVSYRDYRRQMRAAADGLYAAGLDPRTDCVLNLLGHGHLYGGLLSSSLILDMMDVKHFSPETSGHDNYHDIAGLIARHGVNTLFGLPSAIYQLFWRAERSLRAYGGVRKIFLGDEQVSLAQRQFFASFGVELVRPALYGVSETGLTRQVRDGFGQPPGTDVRR